MSQNAFRVISMTLRELIRDLNFFLSSSNHPKRKTLKTSKMTSQFANILGVTSLVVKFIPYSHPWPCCAAIMQRQQNILRRFRHLVTRFQKWHSRSWHASMWVFDDVQNVKENNISCILQCVCVCWFWICKEFT